ncbi:MAG: murein L,D-transpeptidase catalytic domain-containing protein [Pseudomonadota bacterium]
MNRRDLIKTGLAVGAATALPVKLSAQPLRGSARDRTLFAIAKRELDKAGSAIWKRDIVGIADFGVHSANRRFHFVNMDRQEVNSFHVSHGAGSDPEHDGWLNRYSNVEGSNATSKGAYVTWEWYQGKYGTSVRLGGLDSTNDAALRRYIVMHQAAYAEPSHIDRWGRLGRSNGCFALGEEQFKIALMSLSGGRLIYADSLGLVDEDTVSPPKAPLVQPLQPAEPNATQRYTPGSF